MNQATDFEKQRSDIHSATERLIARRPFLEPILRPYADLCLQRIDLVEKLAADRSVASLAAPVSEAPSPVPLVNGRNIQGLKEALDFCFPFVLGALEKAFEALGPQLQRLTDLHRRQDLGELARAFLVGETAPIEACAAAQDVELGTLNLLLQGTLGPVLARVGRTAGVSGDHFGSNEGTCPVCGFLPAVSSLSPAGDLGSEFLRGGGGQRWLHCALCGFSWRIVRGKCPACGNQDHDRQRVYQVEGDDGGERLDICLACNGYLPGIDLREAPSPMPPEIAAGGMIHLDAWAAQNGYHPLVQTPWNRMK